MVKQEISIYSQDVGSQYLDRTARLSSEFNAPQDTHFYYEGICQASRLLKEIIPNQPVRMLDLGCNSGIPDITGIRQGFLDSALGVEISPAAVKKGERMRRLLHIPDSNLQFVCQNILDEKTRIVAEEFRPNLIAGNLPYLPALSSTPREVSGGKDGTEFVPSVILDYARVTEAPVATMNLCSLVDVNRVVTQIQDGPYYLYQVLMMNAPFGRYTQQLYEEGVLDRLQYQPYYFTDPHLHKYQAVINMIVVSTKYKGSSNPIGIDQICNMLEHFSTTGKLDI